MSNYFCPECGYDGDDPICPHCNIPTEKLDFVDDTRDDETYPDDVVKKVEGEADVEPIEQGADILDKDDESSHND